MAWRNCPCWGLVVPEGGSTHSNSWLVMNVAAMVVGPTRQDSCVLFTKLAPYTNMGVSDTVLASLGTTACIHKKGFLSSSALVIHSTYMSP